MQKKKRVKKAVEEVAAEEEEQEESGEVVFIHCRFFCFNYFVEAWTKTGERPKTNKTKREEEKKKMNT